MVYALAFGLSIGAMSLVARRMGEKDEEAAARTAVQAIALGLLFGIPRPRRGRCSPHLAPGDGRLALGAGARGELHAGDAGANVSVCLLFLINAIFRGAGDAATAMRVLWLANGINIVLGPCLVFGVGPFPRMGVVGAALATSIGRTTGVLYQLYRLTRGDGRLTVRMRHVRLEAKTMLSVLRLSGAGTLQTVVGMTSWIFLVRIISRFGSQAVAGYTIAIRLILFALLPSFGLANAAATLVGQNLGAKKPDRAERAAWKAGHVGAIFLGTVGLVFIAVAPQIVGIFTDRPAWCSAMEYAGFASSPPGFAFYAYGMTFTQSLNGAGETWAPTWLNALCFWAFELPLAWVLAVHAGLATTGRVHRLSGGLQSAGGGERGGLPPWGVEAGGGLAGTLRWTAAKEPASPMARHCASSHQGAGLKPVRRSRARGPLGLTPRSERRRLDCALSRHHLLSPRRANADPVAAGQPVQRFLRCTRAASRQTPGRTVARVTGVRQHPGRSSMAGWTTEVTLDVAWGEMDALGQ